VLPFDGLWYGEPDATSNAIDYAEHRSRSHDAVIRVYDESGSVIETYEHTRRVKIVDDEAFPDYAMPKKTTGRKNKAPSTRTNKA
jgi:hypothetical protein